MKRITTAAAAACAVGLMGAAPAAKADVWNAMLNKQWKGPMTESGDNIADYAYQITVYKMEDGGYADGDFYRVDQALEVGVKKYTAKKAACGWYGDRVKIAFALKTKNGGILEYEPVTFSGSARYSKSVALKQGLGAPTVTPKYSMSTAVPDAGIKVKRDIPNETIVWDGELRGCKTAGASVVATAKIFEEASKLSKTSYKMETTVLVQVPEGADFRFDTKVGKEASRVLVGRKRYRAGKARTVTKLVKEDFAKRVWCGKSSCTAR